MGFVVLEKVDFEQLRSQWRSEAGSADEVELPRPNIPLTYQEMLARRKGVEGRLWPGDPNSLGLIPADGFVSASQLPVLEKYLSKLSSRHSLEVLWCQWGPLFKGPCRAPVGCRFVGFDVVLFPCEDDGYSSILNEAVYGQHPDLVGFVDHVNYHLLFDDPDVAHRYVSVRSGLTGKRDRRLEHVGEGDYFEAVAVYLCPELARTIGSAVGGSYR